MPYKKYHGRNSNYRWGIICLLAIALLPLSSTITQASSYYWRVSSGDWSDVVNWGGIAPTSGNVAYIQNGGTATITQTGEQCYSLFLGNTENSGTIQMTGGSLSVSYISYYGFSGMGTFTQTGGINSISSNLYLGCLSGSSGTYDLGSTGQLNASSECLGIMGTGTFMQTGGTNSIINDLLLGDNSGSSGTYNLSGTGQLSASTEYIGDFGTGTFTQTGGTNTISRNLYIGYDSGSSGTYNLSGGALILKSLRQGSGTATFNFGGGTLQTSGDFTCSFPMTLTGDGGNANIDTAGYAVTLSGVLSGDGGLNKLGSGTLTISNTATYGGDTTVDGGMLCFASGIGPGGTSLIDVESGTAVLKTVSVSKSDLDIYTATSAIFEAADGTHTVGDITGIGTTQVDSGVSLTAASISQGTLIIGSGATVTIQAITAGSTTDNAIVDVPEPSTLILLAATILMLAYSRARKWGK